MMLIVLDVSRKLRLSSADLIKYMAQCTKKCGILQTSIQNSKSRKLFSKMSLQVKDTVEFLQFATLKPNIFSHTLP